MHRFTAVLAAWIVLHAPLRGQIATFPFTESFDSVIPPALPAGWSSSQNRSPGVNDFTTISSSPRSAPNAIVSTNATIGQTLTSPLFSFQGVMPESLVLYTRRSSTHTASVVVEVSLDGGGVFPLVIGDTLHFTVASTYVRSAIPLPETLSTSSSVVFRWRILPASSGTTGTFRIDDISLSARGLDDLALTGFITTPSLPAQTDPVLLSVTVVNTGVRTSRESEVSFYIDADGDSVAQAGELTGTVPVAENLDPGDSVRVTFMAGTFDPGPVGIIAALSYVPDGNRGNDTVRTILHVGYAPHTVVVNEIMYAPSGDEPEWLELLNTSTGTPDVAGWQIADANTLSRYTLTSSTFHVGPLDLLLVTEDSSSLRAVHPAIAARILQVPSLPSLNNTGDAVVLFDDRGAVMDSLTYASSWGGLGGHSLERRDGLASSIDPANWAGSEDSSGSTPGASNSVARRNSDLAIRSLIIDPPYPTPGTDALVAVDIVNEGRLDVSGFTTELYNNLLRDSLVHPHELVASVPQGFLGAGDSVEQEFPVPVESTIPVPLIARILFSPDEDTADNVQITTLSVGQTFGSVLINEIMYEPLTGQSEYVELVSNGKEIDLSGWSIADRPGSDSTANVVSLAASPSVLHEGEYFVIAADSSILQLFPSLLQLRPGLVVITGNTLSLGNDGDRITAHDPSGRTIDSLDYLPEWHHPDVVDETGRSLEKITPALPSHDARNWSTCTILSGGTPGESNSVTVEDIASDAALSASPNPFSPDGDGHDDFAVIHYRIPQVTGSVSIAIYDVRGRLIRRLASREPGGAEGTTVWDGRDEEKVKARIGMYILYIEAFDFEGNVIDAAKTVVVLAGQL